MMNESRVARPSGRAKPTGHPATPSRYAKPHRHSGPMRDSVEFLRGFLRNPAQVGSVIPSSHWLEQRLVREADLSSVHTAVELGPGTGGTTAAFLQSMGPAARLLAIELDSNFHQHLRSSIHDPRFLLEQGSAEQLEDFLIACRLPRPQAIISGIPFSTMPPEVSDRIAAVIARVLTPGGRFVAYQVRAHVAGFVSPYLGTPEKKSWEVINVPPVRVFSWVKPEA